MSRSFQKKNGDVNGDGRCDVPKEQHGKFLAKCTDPIPYHPHIQLVIDSIRGKYGGNVNSVTAMNEQTQVTMRAQGEAFTTFRFELYLLIDMNHAPYQPTTG